MLLGLLIVIFFFLQWAALLRTHVRRQEGLRPIFELLSVEQEYVVRAVALALRNLALEERNKELTGRVKASNCNILIFESV